MRANCHKFVPTQNSYQRKNDQRASSLNPYSNELRFSHTGVRALHIKGRIFAVASSGGHWEQLMAVHEAFADHDIIYATTIADPPGINGDSPIHVLPDCNARQPLASLHCAWRTLRLIHRLRPEFVVSTGAAPGVFALFFGKFYGARTVWIDSVANAERLSLSGRLTAWFADQHLVQWQHLARGGGSSYWGSVL